MPPWLWAGFWGLVASSALLIGAVLGYLVRVPRRLIAAIMAFGAGVLISALAFELMEEAYEQAHDFAGLITVAGFLAAFALTKLGA
jgi:zinc transporter, ZIP family